MELGKKDVDMCTKDETFLRTIKNELENVVQVVLKDANSFIESDSTNVIIKTEGSELELKLEESWQDRYSGTIKEEVYPVSENKIKKEEGSNQDMVKYENNMEGDTMNFLIKNEEIDIKCEEITKDESWVMPELQSSSVVWSSALSETSLDAKDQSSSDEAANKCEKSAELLIYKCEMCTYQSKVKHNFKRHMARHLNPKPFKCDVCPHKTNCITRLKRHMYSHLPPSDRPIYKCGLCPYKATFLRSLNMHLETHKNPSEVKMYHCELCPYQTIHKKYLTRHKKQNKNCEEWSHYTCDLCNLEFKGKQRLAYHKQWHNQCTSKE